MIHIVNSHQFGPSGDGIVAEIRHRGDVLETIREPLARSQPGWTEEQERKLLGYIKDYVANYDDATRAGPVMRRHVSNPRANLEVVIDPHSDNPRVLELSK